MTWILIAIGASLAKDLDFQVAGYIRSALEAHDRKRNEIAHVDERSKVKTSRVTLSAQRQDSGDEILNVAKEMWSAEGGCQMWEG
jgi:hypothetical protein